MLNKYPLWKYIGIFIILVIGTIYSIPNLYPDDHALQVSGNSVSLEINQATVDRVSKILKDANFSVKSVSLEKDTVLARLVDPEEQVLAKDVLQKALGNDYVVALNLAPTTPHWLAAIGARPMKLGLDLSGGVNFLLEVDNKALIEKRINMYNTEIKSLLRTERVRYRSLPAKESNSISLMFADTQTLEKAEKLIRSKFNQFVITQTTQGTNQVLTLQISEAVLKELYEYAVTQNLQTVRNRVNELGVSEPVVRQQGANHIVVELPGIQDTADAKRIMGKAANLEFRLAAKAGASAASTETFEFKELNYAPVNLDSAIILTGDQVANAKVGFDQRNNRPQVEIELDGHGGDLMRQATQNNVGNQMAVIFIEQKPETHYETKNIDGVDKEVPVEVYVADKKVISYATIQSVLGSRFVITGLKSTKEAGELALLLRAGGLAAPMKFVEERTLGSTLGADNKVKGIHSTIYAIILIAAFMIVVYKFFGVIATIALIFNLILLTALMSIIGATLTLPGIAGIVLTLGMAIDANVLIYSRIKEELALGMSVQRAIHEGFDRAFTAILDSNLTSLLVGVILFQLGSGPIKGFAVTLSLGIITSLFTAVVVTRAMVNLIFGGRNVKKLWI